MKVYVILLLNMLMKLKMSPFINRNIKVKLNFLVIKKQHFYLEHRTVLFKNHVNYSVI